MPQEPRKSDAPQLRDEYRTYKILVGCRESSHSLCTALSPSSLTTVSTTAGIPNVYYFGQEGLHNILVIDLLGPSLEDLFDHCGRRFSLKTVIQVAKQMVSNISKWRRVFLLIDSTAVSSSNNSREEPHLSRHQARQLLDWEDRLAR